MIKKLSKDLFPFRIVHTGNAYRDVYEQWKKDGAQEPFRYTAKRIHGNPAYADPPDARNVDFTERLTEAGPFSFDAYGRPINPLITAEGKHIPEGRGLLGKWGPNTAEDKLVLRISDAGTLQILLVERDNPSDGWAIPGGMTEPGEKKGETATREFLEEVIDTESMTKEERQQLTAYIHDHAALTYKGPMDDPRNTKNAWMFATAYRVTIPPEIVALMKLRPQKGEARDVRWFDVHNLEHVKFYASHAYVVAKALQEIQTQGKLHALALEQSLSVKTRSQIGAALATLEKKYA